MGIRRCNLAIITTVKPIMNAGGISDMKYYDCRNILAKGLSYEASAGASPPD